MRLAAEQGALTIDADRVVHELLNHDTAVQEAVVTEFGPVVRLEDGRINRSALGAVVFNDPQALRRLEQIIHPAVSRQIAHLIQSSKARIIMIEAIKLLEGKLRYLCQEIWVTTCSYEQQLERLQVCRGVDEATARARIEAQAPAAEKIAQANVVIDTGGLMRDTEQQFAEAWSRIVEQLA